MRRFIAMCISRLHLPLHEVRKLPVVYAFEALRDHAEFTSGLVEVQEKGQWHRLQSQLFILVNTMIALVIGKKAMYRSPDDLLPLPWQIKDKGKNKRTKPTIEEMRIVYEKLKALDTNGHQEGKSTVRPDHEGI